LDKWLWAARFFKTRSLATLAVTGGHVRLNGRSVKPSRTVVPGDTISISKGPVAWTIVIRETSTRRGGASVAATLYEETQESALSRERAMAERRAIRAEQERARAGARPSKRDRRRLERWRDHQDDVF
jgi:ribosome-associated heat shock protein Hsp15